MEVSVWRLSLFSLLWALLLLPNGQAQIGSIRGKVMDNQGKPIENVLIRIESVSSTGRYQLKTKKDGTYYHGGIPLSGSYKVVAQKEGYITSESMTRPALDPFEKTGKVDFALVPGKSTKAASELTEAEKQKLRREQEQQKKRKVIAAEVRQYYKEGIGYYNTGQYELAIKAFEAALEKDDQQSGLWSNLALAYFHLNRFDESIENYEKAIGLAPENPSLYQGLGDAYSESKDFEKAQEAYEQSANLASDLDPREAANSYYNMGVTFINNGRTEDAVKVLEKAVQVYSQHAEARYQLGISLLGVDRMDEAIEHLKSYIELEPEGENTAVARQLVEQLQN